MCLGKHRRKGGRIVELVLKTLPRVDVLRLSVLQSLPTWHPEHDVFVPFPVNGFVIHHPDGPIVFDTGIGHGNTDIDSMYGHESRDLITELHQHRIDERDVVLLANSHLHFDHCGQNARLRAPIVVQREELRLSQEPGYTIAEWAAIAPEQARVVNGDVEVAPGVRVLHTPGHTPGHQSLVIDAADGCIVIAAQCIFRASGWTGDVENKNLHDDTWRQTAEDSIKRLRSLHPTRVLLSHDDLAIEPSSETSSK